MTNKQNKSVDVVDEILEENPVGNHVIERIYKSGKTKYITVPKEEDILKEPEVNPVDELNARIHEWFRNFSSVAQIELEDFLSDNDMEVKAPRWAWDEFFQLAKEVRDNG